MAEHPMYPGRELVLVKHGNVERVIERGAFDRKEMTMISKEPEDIFGPTGQVVEPRPARSNPTKKAAKKAAKKSTAKKAASTSTTSGSTAASTPTEEG